VRQFNAALTDHFQIACAQFVAEVSHDTEDDDLLVEMPPFEQVRVRRHPCNYDSAAQGTPSLHQSPFSTVAPSAGY